MRALVKSLGEVVRVASPVVARLPAEEMFTHAAIGGCGDSSCCQCSRPRPMLPTGADDPSWIAGVTPRRRMPGCGTFPLVSELTTVPGGTVVPITIEPSKGCFRARFLRVFAIDLANPQSLQRFSLNRFFVGPDCPQDCRIEGMLSDFLQSDECLGCPIGDPEEGVVFGLASAREELNVEVTNLNGGGSIQVQVGVWGECLPGYTCITAYRDTCKPKAA